MAQAKMGMALNPDGHERPVGAMALVNPDGSEIARNEQGLTPYENSVLILLRQIRDRLPQPAEVPTPAKTTPTISAKSQPKA